MLLLSQLCFPLQRALVMEGVCFAARLSPVKEEVEEESPEHPKGRAGKGGSKKRKTPAACKLDEDDDQGSDYDSDGSPGHRKADMPPGKQLRSGTTVGQPTAKGGGSRGAPKSEAKTVPKSRRPAAYHSLADLHGVLDWCRVGVVPPTSCLLEAVKEFKSSGRVRSLPLNFPIVRLMTLLPSLFG